jgi:hypothetical protein
MGRAQGRITICYPRVTSPSEDVAIVLSARLKDLTGTISGLEMQKQTYSGCPVNSEIDQTKPNHRGKSRNLSIRVSREVVDPVTTPDAKNEGTNPLRRLSRFLMQQSRIPSPSNRNPEQDQTSMASERERELRRRRKRRKEVLKDRVRVARKAKKKKRA